jgi:hypothetical protein
VDLEWAHSILLERGSSYLGSRDAFEQGREVRTGGTLPENG